MLLAHLVPGYFAAVKSESQWNVEWSRAKRWGLWGVALFSTFAPDLDVIYNGLFRGFLNHSTLWTHSIFVHLGVALVWVALHVLGCWRYVETLVGLAAFGGLSHLLLDTFAHGTILLYPSSMYVFVAPFAVRALGGGFYAYLTDPVFLVEVFLRTLPIAHFTTKLKIHPGAKTVLLCVLFSGYIVFAILFFVLLPTLQKIAEPYYG